MCAEILIELSLVMVENLEQTARKINMSLLVYQERKEVKDMVRRKDNVLSFMVKDTEKYLVIIDPIGLDKNGNTRIKATILFLNRLEVFGYSDAVVYTLQSSSGNFEDDARWIVKHHIMQLKKKLERL